MMLIKVDHEAHIGRWYLIVVQPTLLDKSAVICAVATAEEAEELAQELIAKRIKRGYVPA